MRRDTKITLTILSLILIVAAAYTWYSRATSTDQVVPPQPAVQQAQDGTYTSLAGDPVTFDPTQHRATIVISWASWCPTCATELSQAVALSETFATSAVSVIAMNRAESATRIKQYLSAMAPTVSDSAVTVLADPDDHLFASIDGYTVPETVVIDATGTIIHHSHGPLVRTEIERIVAATLE